MLMKKIAPLLYCMVINRKKKQEKVVRYSIREAEDIFKNLLHTPILEAIWIRFIGIKVNDANNECKHHH